MVILVFIDIYRVFFTCASRRFRYTPIIPLSVAFISGFISSYILISITGQHQKNFDNDDLPLIQLNILHGRATINELSFFLINIVNDNCSRILTKENKEIVALNKLYRSKRTDLENNLRQLLPGSVESHSGNSDVKTVLYHLLGRQEWIKTVCEIGFNAGHSSLVWLTASNKTFVYSFDIAEHTYTKQMVQYLQNQFPGRLKLTFGDSMHTIPQFIRDNLSVKCDLIVVDGGHTTETAKADLINMRELANKDHNLLIFDDYPVGYPVVLKELGPSWIQARKDNFVANIINCIVYPYTEYEGLTIGYYKF